MEHPCPSRKSRPLRRTTMTVSKVLHHVLTVLDTSVQNNRVHPCPDKCFNSPCSCSFHGIEVAHANTTIPALANAGSLG